MSYSPYGVKLSDGQKEKLPKALLNNSAITIRLTKNDLTGQDDLMFTKTQLKRIQKAIKNGTGVDLKISKTQIRKVVKEGGSLWTSLFSLGSRLLPYATKAVTKAAPALATGAMTALGSLGVDKIFGKGQSGGFLIPQNKIDQLIKYKDWLTNAQKKQIVSAFHTGGQLVIKPTKSQNGGFLGRLLGSIGVPLLLNALTGKGLHVDRQRLRQSTPIYVPNTTTVRNTLNKDGGLIVPAFFGSWKNPVGMGIKKNKKKCCQKKKKDKG